MIFRAGSAAPVREGLIKAGLRTLTRRAPARRSRSPTARSDDDSGFRRARKSPGTVFARYRAFCCLCAVVGGLDVERHDIGVGRATERRPLAVCQKISFASSVYRRSDSAMTFWLPQSPPRWSARPAPRAGGRPHAECGRRPRPLSGPAAPALLRGRQYEGPWWRRALRGSSRGIHRPPLPGGRVRSRQPPRSSVRLDHSQSRC